MRHPFINGLLVAAACLLGQTWMPLRAQGPAAPGQSGQQQVQLQEVASFEHQVTGVAVAGDGRIFVSFPRWTEDSPVSVAEVTRDGAIRPYPNEQWNNWRNAKKNQMAAQDHWVSVQSVFTDGRGNLWVLDPAAPATERVVPGGPKLVKIDLARNAVAQIIRFDESVAPPSSYLNDVRISPDGKHAYLTDSGKGALVVVDLASGVARRVLDAHPSTRAEKNVVVKTDGTELRRPDGRAPEFAADGIALSPDGRFLYWQALTGKTLYRVATDALQDANLPARNLESQVEQVAQTGVSDGYWMDARGRLYISALEEDAIKAREPDGRMFTVVQDKRLRWPDSFSEGPDGAIYVTSSRIQDNAWFKPDAGPRLATQLWRFIPPPAGGDQTTGTTRRAPGQR